MASRVKFRERIPLGKTPARVTIKTIEVAGCTITVEALSYMEGVRTPAEIRDTADRWSVKLKDAQGQGVYSLCTDRKWEVRQEVEWCKQASYRTAAADAAKEG